MTEARLKELQELHNVKEHIGEIQQYLNDSESDITIAVDMADIRLAEMHVTRYPEFFDAFKQFIYTQYLKYKEAFDNA